MVGSIVPPFGRHGAENAGLAIAGCDLEGMHSVLPSLPLRTLINLFRAFLNN